MTDEERRRLRHRWQARHAPPELPASVNASTAPSEPAPLTRRRPVPKMPRKQKATPISSRPMVVLGAVLLAGLTILAFAGGRLFGSAADIPPSNDPDMQIASSGFPTPSSNPDSWAADVPMIPTATGAGGQRVPVVCLDPGHGGPDSGFTRFWSELAPALEEKNLVLEHAWDLEARLKQRGYAVVMTRRTDVAVNASGEDVNGDGMTARDDRPGEYRHRNLDEFQARINVCNAANADLLVSMHVNGYTTSGPRGYEVWYTEEREFGEQNRAFAGLAYTALKDGLAQIDYVLPPELERGVNPDSVSNVQTPNTIFRHFIITGPEAPGLIEPSQMPGAIVEALFISNDTDAAVLASPAGRNAIVNAYERAIVDYFEQYPPE